jgi:hypothetical protein
MRALGRRISDGVQRTSALTRLTWSATEGGQFLSRMLSGTTVQQPNSQLSLESLCLGT